MLPADEQMISGFHKALKKGMTSSNSADIQAVIANESSLGLPPGMTNPSLEVPCGWALYVFNKPGGSIIGASSKISDNQR